MGYTLLQLALYRVILCTRLMFIEVRGSKSTGRYRMRRHSFFFLQGGISACHCQADSIRQSVSMSVRARLCFLYIYTNTHAVYQ